MTYIRIFIVAITAAFIFTACGGKKGSELELKKKELSELKTQSRTLTDQIAKLEKEVGRMDPGSKAEVKPKNVGIDTLGKINFQHFEEVQGQVDAADNVLAMQPMPGMVTQIMVREGDHVGRGQVLYLTDASTYEKQIAIVETQLALARTAYEKQDRLWKQNIGSEIQLLTAQTNKEALEKQIATLRATIELSKCKSPIDGSVDEVRVKLGDMAAPSALMPGVRVINGSRIVVKAKMSDAHINDVHKGDKVKVVFPDIDRTVDAVVTFVAQVVDRQTRTFNIEVRLDNRSNEIKANIVAKLLINDKSVNGALVVPTNLIQHSEQGDYVLIAVDGKAVKKLITAGASYNGQTVITTGLTEGDAIINFGYSEVVDGQAITY
jgi:membrane fusion protein, multidrug efflux system